jgi:hypothetical protein
MCSFERSFGREPGGPSMLATPLLLAFALGLLVPLGSRIGGRGEGGTFLAVTLTVLAVVAGLAVTG